MSGIAWVCAQLTVHPVPSNGGGGVVDREQTRDLIGLALKIAIGLCVANFLVYLAGSIVLGGDALNQGSIVNGHYYIKSHGRTKEVTQGLFEYSRWQASSLKLTQPIFLAAFAGIFLLKVYAKR
jgi:hypothetical protein